MDGPEPGLTGPRVLSSSFRCSPCFACKRIPTGEVTQPRSRPSVYDVSLARLCASCDHDFVRESRTGVISDVGMFEVILCIRECLEATSLEDLRYDGCRFAWSNRVHEDKACCKKIERVLCNGQCLIDHISSERTVPNAGVSDHSSMIVMIGVH
ncbi:hypothetical protein AKJ16_DCAP20004, partial [Drosera capensis]